MSKTIKRTAALFALAALGVVCNCSEPTKGPVILSAKPAKHLVEKA